MWPLEAVKCAAPPEVAGRDKQDGRAALMESGAVSAMFAYPLQGFSTGQSERIVDANRESLKRTLKLTKLTQTDEENAY